MRVLAALTACVSMLVVAAPATPAPPQSPNVLRVLATGFSIVADPTSVALGRYTVQVHNIGAQPVRVTIGKTVDVVVPENGWRFVQVRFARPGSYSVRARSAAGGWIAVLAAG